MPSAQLAATEASDDMVIDYAHGLHEGVTDRWADKAEAALFERAAHRLRRLPRAASRTDSPRRSTLSNRAGSTSTAPSSGRGSSTFASWTTSCSPRRAGHYEQPSGRCTRHSPRSAWRCTRTRRSAGGSSAASIFSAITSRRRGSGSPRRRGSDSATERTAYEQERGKPEGSPPNLVRTLSVGRGGPARDAVWVRRQEGASPTWDVMLINFGTARTRRMSSVFGGTLRGRPEAEAGAGRTRTRTGHSVIQSAGIDASTIRVLRYEVTHAWVAEFFRTPNCSSASEAD